MPSGEDGLAHGGFIFELTDYTAMPAEHHPRGIYGKGGSLLWRGSCFQRDFYLFHT
ncbi:hypothetical protein [Maridesulfovibrio sp.]|uniref:hypothetical protein n=1 Tax=Maridesulfovibrio sp. TaxID=2795000 RepID=UPI0039F102D0